MNAVTRGERTDTVFFFFQAEDGIRDLTVTGVQTCALPISGEPDRPPPAPTRQETPVSPARRARPLLRLSYGGRQLLADDLVHQLAVRPALELGHHLSHDLSEILRSTGNRLPHGAPDLVGVDRGGQELLERLPLGELRLRPVGAAGGGVLLGRFTAAPDTAAPGLRRLLIRNRALELR